jgi:hypothetical protein
MTVLIDARPFLVTPDLIRGPPFFAICYGRSMERDPTALPQSVRYVKNGERGRWWSTAKARNEMHLGWRSIPHDLLLRAELDSIERLLREQYGPKLGATQDFNMLRTLLDRPSQHLWITFEEGCLWWCTVRDDIHVNDVGNDALGNFWLECDQPWRNTSIGGRHLATANLPGSVTTTAGFRATVCEPRGAADILRIIRDEQDSDVIAADDAKEIYQAAIEKIVTRLRERDFELLIDLILARTGWVRLAKLGGTTEGIDIEAENVSVNEVAFVQVKSTADQAVLNDYVSRFDARRGRYDRMIFAVHSPRGTLQAPADKPVQVWTRADIARLVVQLGLGDWVASKI